MRNKSETDREKLRAIYEAYRNRMYIVACRVLDDPYRAEDAVHEAFIAISRNVGKLGAVDSVSTASYVIKAARNTALNMIKKNQREETVSLEDVTEKGEDILLDELCVKENCEAVVRAILALDEKYRDVLSLYYLNELTVKEIADTLSLKEGTVKQRLARGRRLLISNIEKEVSFNEEERNA